MPPLKLHGASGIPSQHPPGAVPYPPLTEELRAFQFGVRGMQFSQVATLLSMRSDDLRCTSTSSMDSPPPPSSPLQYKRRHLEVRGTHVRSPPCRTPLPHIPPRSQPPTTCSTNGDAVQIRLGLLLFTSIFYCFRRKLISHLDAVQFRSLR